jgi:hypothetical protein
MGVGVGGLGDGVGGMGPTPQSPIPNPQSPIPINSNYFIIKKIILLKYIIALKLNHNLKIYSQKN